MLLPDPVYPVYRDSNLMAGRRVTYLAATRANGFAPLPDETLHADLVYLCSPANPTGAAYTKEQLKVWVDWALANDAVILYDAAYECFIQADLPHSIYEVEGAKECAIEVCSLSKTAGFTGMRCGYTVVPHGLVREGQNLHDLWLRRQCTKMNGVAYPIQRAAEAVFTPEGMAACREDIAAYLRAAAIVADALDELGIWYCGGKNSPYIWMECPKGMDSWQFFDALLETPASSARRAAALAKTAKATSAFRPSRAKRTPAPPWSACAPGCKAESLHRKASAPETPGRSFLCVLMAQSCGNEAAEDGLGLVGPALELRVVLHAHEEGVVGQLHGLHQPPVG